ncbi:MAG TPA: SPW repeat protein [Polyangiales bacterium]|nr:SPW repeat protein [Polyangiales bacterium]
MSVFYTSLAVAAIGFPLMRNAKQALAVWLFASAWLLPRASEATLWNNLLVALAMAAISARVDAPTAG